MTQAARWTAIVALFTIPFLPLYVSNDLFFPFITGKGFAFRILVEIAFVAWAVLAIMDRKYRPRFSWTLVLFGALTAWMAIANLLGVNPHKAFWSNFERMDGWVMLIHVFMLFVAAGSVLSVEKLWRKWWLTFLGVAALTCGYGLLQLGGAAEIHQGGARVDASFGNAIYMAVYLMFSILIAAWLAIESRGWLRYSLVGLIALASVILFYTASRGALIGLMAGASFAAAAWMLFAWKDTKANKQTQTGLRIAAGVLAALVLLAGGFFLARDSAFVQNEPALARLSTVFQLNTELKVRSTIWSMALEGVAEDPLTGYGQEGFNQVFNKYYDPALYLQEAWFDRAHNMYIDWLVAGGIPALALFVLLLAYAGWSLYRAPAASRAERVLLTAALVAYAIQALVVFDNLFSYVPLVMLSAMAHAARSCVINRVELLPVVSSDTARTSVGAAGVVLALAAIWTVNVPNIAGAHHLVYAVSPLPQGPSENLAYFKKALADGSFATQEMREQLVMFAARTAQSEDAPDAFKDEVLTFAIAEMGKEVERSPNDARLRLQLSSAYDAAGQGELGLEQTDAAIVLSPKKQTLHIRRGYQLWELRRMEEAVESFRTAYELDTSFPEVASAAAAGMVLAGDVLEADALLLEAFATTTVDSDSLFYAYYQAKLWDRLIASAQLRVANEKGSAESRYRLAQVYAAAGRFEAARLEIVSVMAQFPNTRVTGEKLLKSIFTPAR